MPFFKVHDKCSLYYEIIGDGPGKPTITLINGTLQTTVYWKLVSKDLADHFRLIIYDARGQGESDLGDLPLSLQLHVEDLKALLFELGIRQTHLLGISHGARVALALAKDSPGLVSRMVLCSLSTRATIRAKMIVRSWYEILQRHSLDAMVWAAVPLVFGRNYLRDNRKALERLVKTIVRRNKTDSLRAHLTALQHYPPLSSLLHKTAGLVLVVTGEDDPLVTLEGAREIARICGGRQEEFKGVGHSIPAEAPEEFNALVKDFLGSMAWGAGGGAP
jgi:pimeloyl-ACP methyl ester carboxylesterase